MLRFERKSRNPEVSISLRNQEKVLNRLSMTAFGLALGLHLFGILLFQISPFTISGITTVLPPVVVRADPASASDSIVYAVIEGQNEITANISKPPFLMPDLPKIQTNHHISFDPGEL